VAEQSASADMNERKVGIVMREFKKGKLRAGSKKGPKVTARKQAVAIAMSEAGMSRKPKVKKPKVKKK